jgi:hypothetical protein
VDEDKKKLIDSSVAESQTHAQSVADQTKKSEPERYYDLWEFNATYGNLWLSMVLGGKAQKDSLMVTGFTMMQAEAYTILTFVAEGKYFAAFRELRYLLEFAKRAAALDCQRSGVSLVDKMKEYEAREAADDANFRGGGLLKFLEQSLKLTQQEVKRIKDLFGELSSYAHGSFIEVKPFTPGNSAVPQFQSDLFQQAHDSTAAVTDVYLLLLHKLGMIDSSVVRIPASLSALFPLSYPYLK